MSYWHQLRILLEKELKVIRRTKLWALFEIAIPLMIALPLLILVNQVSPTANAKARHFPVVRVTGDVRDIYNQLPGLSSFRYDCGLDEMILGLVFPKDVDRGVVQRIADQLASRYFSDPYFELFGILIRAFPNPFNLSVQIFSSEIRMVKTLQADFNYFQAIKNDPDMDWYCPRYFGGIVFTEYNPSKQRLAYTLLMRQDPSIKLYLTDEIWSPGGPFSLMKDGFPLNREPNYWSLGLLSLQHAVDSIFLQDVDDEQHNETHFALNLRRIPEPAYHIKAIMDFLSFLTMFWQLFVTPSIIHTVSNIVSEKESGMKAYLKVMGLKSPIFYISHAIIASIKINILLLISSLILVPMLETVSPALFIVISLVYGVGAVSFALLMSTVMNSEGAATKGVALIWLCSIAVTLIPLSSPGTASSTLLSLNLNYAFSTALQAIQDYMNRDIYLGWKNTFEDMNYMYPIGMGLVMMCVDIFWMLMLCIYLDNVFPGGDLPRKSLLYFLHLPKKDFPTSLENTEDSKEAAERIEKIENPSEADVEVRRLTKLYGFQVAVNGLSFRAHRGEITVLLGDNGAGKSTTFSIITGLNTPNSGKVIICGKKLERNTVEHCQRDIGFCPQYNPLFNKLTVREHLEFFGQLRGSSPEQVEQMIVDVYLKEAEDKLGEALSGGTKRKLCVGISLIGGSRVVLLDEPTAGMDPLTRHGIIELLKRSKRDRTILLTTHYMDEADQLGDWINILVKGRLYCAGSPKYLKSYFGAGYLLALDFEKETSLTERGEKLLEIIRAHIRNAEVESATTRQLIVLLPSEQKSKFKELFADLEEQREHLDIRSFGVSLNTLQQVFVKISEVAEGNVISDAEEEAKQLAIQLCEDTDIIHGPALWKAQITVLFQKRIICCRRQWLRLLAQAAIPIILFACTVYFTRAMPSEPEKVTIRADRIAGSLLAVQVDDLETPFVRNLMSLVKSTKAYRFHNVSMQQNLSEYLANYPKKPPPLGLAVETETNDTFASVVAYFNIRATYGPIVATTLINNARLGKKADSIRLSLATYGHKGFDRSNSAKQSGIIAAVLIVVFALISSAFVPYIVDDRNTKFIYQQLLTGLSLLTYWIPIVLWDIGIYAVTCAILMLIIVISKWLTGYWLDLFPIWILYIWPAQPFVYLMAFIFKQPTRAYVMTVVICLVVPICAGIAAKIMGAISPKFYNFFHMISMLVLPTYSLSHGTILIAEAYNSNSRTDMYTWQNLGSVYFALAVSGIFFWTALWALNSKGIAVLLQRIKEKSRKTPTLPEVSTKANEDPDVVQERNRVFDTPISEQMLAVCNLNRYYGNLHAVKDLTFGIDPDECFGLLGANGAGKTTTFELLSGVLIPDSGQAFIDGRTILEKQVIGFCPQYDALHQDLTARETLYLMASLCGFSNPADRAETLLQAISLTPQADRCMKHCSGGQRRRLSVALALVSHARFIILDEPSAGIDPKTRRRIWNLLSAMREQHRTVLLTSQSMDECDALCSRIGVLDKGVLVAIGTPQHIKSRFGEEYTLSITINDETRQDETVKEVEKMFPNYNDKLLERAHLTWHIKKNEEDRWSVLYAKLDKLTSSMPWVIDYSLAQASLEEAFLRLAHWQQAEERSVSVTPAISSSVKTPSVPGSPNVPVDPNAPRSPTASPVP